MGLKDLFKTKAQKASEQKRFVDLGKIAYSENRCEEALDHYKKALEISHFWMDGEEYIESINQAYIGEILCYIKLNQPDAAKKVFKTMYGLSGRPDYIYKMQAILLDAGIIEGKGGFILLD